MADGNTTIDMGLSPEDLGIEKINPKEERFKLPTTPEIAQKGKEELEALLEKLPPGSAGRLLFNPPENASDTTIEKLIREGTPRQIKRGFAGIGAEVTIERHIMQLFPPEAFTQLQETINTHLENFVMIWEEGNRRYEILNLLAAQMIITNYPEYFPEAAQADPKEWLLNNHSEWEEGRGINGIRYGLFSGFSLDGVTKYPEYMNAENKLTGLAYIFSTDDAQFIRDYTNLTTKSEDDKKRMAEVIARLEQERQRLEQELGEDLTHYKLTDEEKELAVNIHGVDSDNPRFGYYGFDTEGEKRYVQKLGEIYTQSGIDELQ